MLSVVLLLIDIPMCSATSHPEKTTIYSTLVGILNARRFEVGEEVWEL